MKKNITIILAALLAVSLTACGEKATSATNNQSSQQTTSENSKPAESSTPTEASKPEESSAPTESSKPDEPSEPSGNDVQGSAGSALDLLTAAWDKVPEDSKFPIFGGTPGDDEDNISFEGPGAFALEDPATLDTHLGFPAASADKIDGAASLIHMMNANTFTAGAYHVKDAGTISDVTAAIKDNIMSRQWMCGFPEKLVIVTVDDCIVSVFGHGEAIDAFIGGLTAAYPSAQKVCDDPITFGGDPVADVGGFGIPLEWQRADNEIIFV